MALRHVDSFDHYATAQINRKYTSSEGVTPTISAGNGRRGTASLRLNSANVVNVTKGFDSQATWIVGFAFRIAIYSGSGTAAIMAVLDGASIQTDVRLNIDGSLSVTRNATVLSSTAAGIISAASTHFIELKVTIGNAGSYELRVNGATVTSGSGVDTQNTANATGNVIRLGSGTSSTVWTNADYDDLYICDGTGATNNDFLGDVRVDAFFPNGNGNSSQLLGSDGNSTDNYLLVDETSPNDDTDYVQSATATEKDTYAFSDMAHSPPAIYGLQINMQANKTDAAFRSIQSVIRSGGSDNDGTAKPMASSYLNYTQISETDPATAAAWTQTNFNAAEFGVKVAA
jgi:hypothetical protein